MNSLAREVYLSFSNTEYGKTLAGRARYERFRPEDCDLDTWEHLLGRNANNLHHLKQSMDDARDFVDAENSLNPRAFSSEERMILILAGCLHDQAEGHPDIGDIPHGTKTDHQKAREAQVLHAIVEDHIEKIASCGEDVRYFELAREAVFGDKNTKIASAFEAVELIGFMNDVLSAIAQLKSGGPERSPVVSANATENIQTALNRLVAEVLGSGVLERMIDLSNTFPSLRQYLATNSQRISEGYSLTELSAFEWYDDRLLNARQTTEREDRINRFSQQKYVWSDWLNSKSK